METLKQLSKSTFPHVTAVEIVDWLIDKYDLELDEIRPNIIFNIQEIIKENIEFSKDFE